MKFLVVVAISMIAATSAKQVCTPGVTFKKDCNTCSCAPNGMSIACTLMECSAPNFQTPVEESEKQSDNVDDEAQQKTSDDSDVENIKDRVCTPNSFFKMECNECKCSSDGKYAACTMMMCPPNMYNEDGSPKQRLVKSAEYRQSLYICTPDAVFKRYCNTCFCSKDGSQAACTRMFCPPDVFNPDGTFRTISTKQ